MITTGNAEVDAACAAYRKVIGELADELAASAAQISALQAQVQQLLQPPSDARPKPEPLTPNEDPF